MLSYMLLTLFTFCLGHGAYPKEEKTSITALRIDEYVNRKGPLGHYNTPLVQELLDYFKVKRKVDNLFILLRPSNDTAHLIRVKGSLSRSIHYYTQENKRAHYILGLLGTAEQLINHSHVKKHPLSPEMMSALETPTTNHEWDRVRSTGVDGSFSVHEAGNFIGWMKEIPPARIRGILPGAPLTLASLGIKIERNLKHLTEDKRKKIAVIIGYKLRKEKKATSPIRYSKTLIGTGINLPIGASIVHAFIGVGPDASEIIGSLSLQGASSLLWYRRPRMALDRYNKYMTAEKKKAVYQKESLILKAKNLRQRKENIDGTRRFAHHNISTNHRIHYSFHDEKLSGWYCKINKKMMNSFLKISQSGLKYDEKFVVSDENLGLTFPREMKLSESKLLLIEKGPTGIRCYTVPYKSSIPRLKKGHVLIEAYYGTGDDFDGIAVQLKKGTWTSGFGYKIYENKSPGQLHSAYQQQKRWVAAGKQTPPQKKASKDKESTYIADTLADEQQDKYEDMVTEQKEKQEKMRERQEKLREQQERNLRRMRRGFR